MANLDAVTASTSAAKLDDDDRRPLRPQAAGLNAGAVDQDLLALARRSAHAGAPTRPALRRGTLSRSTESTMTFLHGFALAASALALAGCTTSLPSMHTEGPYAGRCYTTSYIPLHYQRSKERR